MDRKILMLFVLSIVTIITISSGQTIVSEDIFAEKTVTERTSVKNLTRAYYTEIKFDDVFQRGNDLAEILGREQGIIYQKSGATGSKSTISIRGMDSRKVLIFLDGVPLNSSLGESVDLSKIEPEMLESAEIYKGYIPARFGGNGFGGVINLRKKTNIKDGKNVEISTTLGSFGEKKFHGGVWYVPHYLLDIYSVFNYQHKDNDFLYLDRNKTPYNLNDDTVKTINNDEYSDFDFLIRPALALKKNRQIFFEFDYSSIDDNIGAPNGDEYKTAKINIKDIGTRVVLSSLKNYDKPLTGEAALVYRNSQSTLFWTSLDKGFGNAHGTLLEGEWARMHHDDYQVSLNGFLNFKVNRKLKIEATILSFYQAFLPENEISADILGDWESFRLSGKISTDVNYSGEYFSASLGGTVDAVMDSTNGGFDEYLDYTLLTNRTYTPATSWRIGVNAFLPGKFINLFANGGRYYKLSTLREKYGFKGGVVPNPQLKDETQYSFDAGMGFEHNLFYGEAVFFYVNTENGIVFMSDGFLLRPENLIRDIVFGGELGITWNLLEKLKVNTNVTFQKSEITYPGYTGNMKPNQPPLALDFGVNAGPFAGLSLLWHFEYKSRYYKDPANTDGKTVPVDLSKFGFGFNHVGLKLAVKRFTLQTYIKNLPLNPFDFDLYGDYALEHLNDSPDSGVGYYWMNYPGIHYHFRASFSF